MRQAMHFVLTMIGSMSGMVTFASAFIASVFFVAAYHVLPNSRYGNCWTYSIPRWIKSKGYLSLRVAEDVRFLKIFPIIHSQWMRKTPQAGAIKQFIPRSRVSGDWFPIHTLYFQGRVVSMDTDHDAKDEK